MNDQQKDEQYSGVRDQGIRAALDQHWARDDKVARETQYFADPFVAPAGRAQWVERMDT